MNPVPSNLAMAILVQQPSPICSARLHAIILSKIPFCRRPGGGGNDLDYADASRANWQRSKSPSVARVIKDRCRNGEAGASRLGPFLVQMRCATGGSRRVGPKTMRKLQRSGSKT